MGRRRRVLDRALARRRATAGTGGVGRPLRAGEVAPSPEDVVRERDEALARLAAADRARRGLNRAYERALFTLRTLATGPYGSLTPGFPGWTERWQEDRPRVLLLATKDHAGSMVQWARALNATTGWAARAVTVLPHPFGYPDDLLVGVPENVAGVETLLHEADVVHVKDEDGFLTGRNALPPDLLTRGGAPVVHTACGSVSRSRQDDADFRRHVLGFDAVVCTTPDLCFDWLPDPHLIGQAVDPAEWEVTWSDVPVVGHAPSRPEVKGTAAVLEAVRPLRDEGLRVDLVTGAGHAEAVRRVGRVGVFVDQAGHGSDGRVVGWYGNAALEAMVQGVPTVAHLSGTATARAARGGLAVDDCPVLRCGTSATSIRRALRQYLDLDPAGRAALSTASRRWVQEAHGFEAVAARLVAAYTSVR